MYEEDEGQRHDDLVRSMLRSLRDGDCLRYEADLPEAMRPKVFGGFRPDIVLETLSGQVVVELKIGARIFTDHTREELHALLDGKSQSSKVVLVVPEDSFMETAQVLETWGLNHLVWLATVDDWIP